jgi:predicted nucleic acid-binding protein
VGARAQEAFFTDLAGGTFSVEWGEEPDLVNAHRICRRHKDLKMGLVDAVVIAIAERLRPAAIATLDLRHLGTVPIRGNPRLFPRDLP